MAHTMDSPITHPAFFKHSANTSTHETGKIAQPIIQPLAQSMPADIQPQHLATKGQRTSQRILDAAEELFANQGIEATTLKQIAEMAILKEPSLYKHYDSKDAIYIAVINRAVQPMLSDLEGLMARELSLPELLNLPRRMMDLLGDHPTAARLIHRELSKSGDAAPPSVKLLFEQVIEQHRLFVIHMTGRRHSEKANKSALLRAIAMMNLTLGFFASAPFFEELIGDEMLDEETLAQQTKLMRTIFAAIFTADL